MKKNIWGGSIALHNHAIVCECVILGAVNTYILQDL